MKRIVFCCLGLFLLLTGFLCGMTLGTRKAEVSVSAPLEQQQAEDDPIDAFRTERQTTRQMQVSQLNELIYSADEEDDVVLMARDRLLQLMGWMEMETTVEGVLRIRGFDDAVVTVHEESVNVLVKSDGLTQQQTTVILEIIMRETGISAGNVKIIPIN